MVNITSSLLSASISCFRSFLYAQLSQCSPRQAAP
jgi:hypothetical protein